MKIDPLNPKKLGPWIDLIFISFWNGYVNTTVECANQEKQMNSEFGLVLSFSPDLLNWPLHHWKTWHGKPVFFRFRE